MNIDFNLAWAVFALGGIYLGVNGEEGLALVCELAAVIIFVSLLITPKPNEGNK